MSSMPPACRKATALAFITDVESGDALEKLRRHETRIRNDIARTLNQLRLLQQWRAEDSVIESVATTSPPSKHKQVAKLR